MVPENFFDVFQIFGSEVIGSTVLFFFIVMILIYLWGNRNGIPKEAVIMISALFMMIFFARTSILWMWMFVGLVIAVFFGIIVSRRFNR